MPASKRQSCNYELWMVNMTNFKELHYVDLGTLVEYDKDTARLLCKSLGYDIDSLDFETFGKAQPAEWMNRTLEVYPSISDFVCCYLDFLTHYRELYPVGDEKTFPALDEYVDIVGYGNRLLEEIGAEYARVLLNGKIVTTDVGW